MCTMINTKETTEGRRIEKVDAIAGTTTRYYYDDQRVAVKTLVSGGVETDDRYFVFGSMINGDMRLGRVESNAPSQHPQAALEGATRRDRSQEAEKGVY